MGNYIFTYRRADRRRCRPTRTNVDSRHDMGGNIIPCFVDPGRGAGLRLHQERGAGCRPDRDQAYWRDVGTIDAYHEAHMDLVSVDPVFNLYNNEWPIWTNLVQMPGAKFTLPGPRTRLDRQPRLHHLRRRIERLRAVAERTGAQGCRGRQVGDPVTNARIGENAVVQRAILDKNVRGRGGRPDRRRSPSQDRARGFTISDGGITVVGKGITRSSRSHRTAGRARNRSGALGQTLDGHQQSVADGEQGADEFFVLGDHRSGRRGWPSTSSSSSFGSATRSWRSALSTASTPPRRSSRMPCST